MMSNEKSTIFAVAKVENISAFPSRPWMLKSDFSSYKTDMKDTKSRGNIITLYKRATQFSMSATN